VTADSQALAPTEEHSPVAHLAHDSRGISNPVLGMLLFITSEVMFFAGLFAAYFNARATADAWPPLGRTVTEHGEGPLFTEVLQPFPLVLPATIILVLSSITCQFAVWAIRRGDHTAFIRNMAVTLVLGITFLVMQAIDYMLLFSEGFTLAGAGAYGTTYYTLTGFHGAHVFGGVIMLGVVVYRGMAGQFSARHHDMVEAASLYWHFVDVVWILLFMLLYGGALVALLPF
jgi:cytochrome c oxidase subunit 3